MRGGLLQIILALLLIGFAKLQQDEDVGDIRRGNFSIQLALILSVPLSPLNTTYSPYHLMEMAAVRYAVELVNKYDLLYGYTLELREVYLWSPWSQSTYVLKDHIYDAVTDYTTAFVIGPETGENLYLAARFSSGFCFPVISYGATYSTYNSDDLCIARTVTSDIYRVEAVLDIIKNLKWSFIGMLGSAERDGYLDLAYCENKLFSLSICSVSFELSERPTDEEIVNVLTKLNATITKTLFLFTSVVDTGHVMKIIQSLQLADRFYFVFVYGKPILDSDFTQSFQKELVGSISIESSFKENEEFQKEFLNRKFDYFSEEEIIAAKVHSEKQGETDISNTIFWHYTAAWEELFQCTTNTTLGTKTYSSVCDKDLRPSLGRGYYANMPVENFLGSVYGAAFGIRGLIEQLCNTSVYKTLRNSSKLCHETIHGINENSKTTDSFLFDLHENIKKYLYPDGTFKTLAPWDKTDRDLIEYDIYNFQFDNRTKAYINLQVGKWQMKRVTETEHSLNKYPRNVLLNTSAIWWSPHYVGKAPDVNCRSECDPYSLKQYTDAKKCCWVCERCPPNNVAVNATCQLCKPTEMITNGKCQELPFVRDDLFKEPFVLVVLILMGVSFIFAVAFLLIFVQKRDAESLQEKSKETIEKDYFRYTILISLSLASVLPIPYVMAPTASMCILRIGAPGIIYVTIYGALLLMYYRISQTFNGTKTRQHHMQHGPLLDMSSLLSFIFAELMILVSFFASSSYVPQILLLPEKMHYTTYCLDDTNPTPLILSLILPLACLIGSTIMAFRTRNFPRKHETKNISYTLYVSFFLWIIFLPVYYQTPQYGFNRRFEMSGFLVIVSMLTVCGLYARKIRMLLWPPEQQMPSSQRTGRDDKPSSSQSSPSTTAVSSQDDNYMDVKSYVDFHCPPNRTPSIIGQSGLVYDGNIFDDKGEESGCKEELTSLMNEIMMTELSKEISSSSAPVL